MSSEQLAAAVGVTRERIDAIEAGDVDLTYDVLVALASALHAQPSALVALAERLAAGSET
jgi:transcriptional regulator with XRE-family HTH domain